MSRRRFTDADRLRLQDAERAYDGQWVLISLIEFPGRSPDTLRRTAQRIRDWEAPPGVEREPLQIEADPEGTRDRIQEHLDSTPGSSCRMPISLCGDEVVIEGELASQAYIFDETADRYIFTVRNRLLTIDGPAWRRIVADYSAQGADMTRQQIAMKYGLNSRDLESCLRMYGHYKARPPFTREEIAGTRDLSPLVERAIEVQEGRLSARIDRERIQRLRQDNEELRRELQAREDVLGDLRALYEEFEERVPRIQVTPREPAPADREFSVVAPVADAHIGLATFKETGWSERDYGHEIALEMIRAHGRAVAREVRATPGRCRVAYLQQLGDTFHAPFGRTEKGRPLQRDAPDHLLFLKAADAFSEQIQAVAGVADRVEVAGVPGNHGHLLDVLLLDFLALRFQGDTRVRVHRHMSERHHFLHGETLHVFDHGTTIGPIQSPKAEAYAARVARTIAGEDYQRASSVKFYVGHEHHRETKNHGHIEIIRIPTFSGSSDFESAQGYYQDAESDVLFLDERGRIQGAWRLRMDEEI